jgi:hypothetical protein
MSAFISDPYLLASSPINFISSYLLLINKSQATLHPPLIHPCLHPSTHCTHTPLTVHPPAQKILPRLLIPRSSGVTNDILALYPPVQPKRMNKVDILILGLMHERGSSGLKEIFSRHVTRDSAFSLVQRGQTGRRGCRGDQ